MSANDRNRETSLAGAAALAEALGPGERLELSGLIGSSGACLVSELYRKRGGGVLAILSTEEEAEAFASDLAFFLGPDEVFHYPSTEVLPFEAQPTHREILARRVELLFRLSDEAPFVLVSSARNLSQKVAPREAVTGVEVEIEAGAEFPMDELTERLSTLGYTRMSMVEERAEMSVRGGIVDLFPPGLATPLRIEFFGDQVESIRTFDLSTQRSIERLDRVRILPAAEVSSGPGARGRAVERLKERSIELGLRAEECERLIERLREGFGAGEVDSLLPLFHEGLDTVFDYLRADTLVALVDPHQVSSALKGFSTEIGERAASLEEQKRFFVRPDDLYLGPDAFAASVGRHPVVGIEPMGGRGREVRVESNRTLRQEIKLKKGSGLLKPLADRVSGWLDEGRAVFLTAHNPGQAERTRELLEGYGLSPGISRSTGIQGSAGPSFSIAVGSLSTGFGLPADGLSIVSEEEVFGERVKRRAAPAKKLEGFLTELQDLTPGSHIVHAHHGIGLYRGLKRLGVDGVDGDFLLLEYRDGDKLYLPVGRMDLVSRYHGVEGRTPRLDKLGGDGWKKTRSKVKKAVELMAGELLKLYAEREVAEGFAFSPPDRLFAEFEASFEYDETPDQARAIEETISDMVSSRPMDRLVCGDVGYGKTEVAIRAAFKAALDGKQTAVLVPTTVLAQQHLITFSRRLSPYPVVVDVLSRFRSRKEQASVMERLGRGEVDILIGTHRLLQNDVAFKDLGLVVIDEEHRFGVKQKERLKQLKRSVDVLTLTATPIPRTLHMSLASIRDLSIINTPPEDRLAIKTSVIRFDEKLLAEAIERELKRGGQVFFVHNRIQSIGALGDFVRRAVPGARVAVAHGKMKEAELEKKMLGFVEGEYDILLSTAIIESGLDIPTANTIIINRADRFGLAELYQLRGRVGRSNHRAYAYFVSPDPFSLTEEARKRIEVIYELCEPGSGFKIATYDLEIRGAGELLGTSQSGQIAEVGFEMYTQLLEESVMELRGAPVVEEIEPEISLRISQYLPEEYIEDTRQRLGIYKRIATARDERDVEALADELYDRYGETPELAKNLLKTAELKILLKRLGARELVQKGTRLYVSFGGTLDEERRGALAARALKLMKDEPKRYRVTPDQRLVVFMGENPEPFREAKYLLKELVNACYS